MSTASSFTDAGRRRIQSVETGHRLLAALVQAAHPLPLGELAAAAEMTSAKAHPYLVSFINVGLVRQDAITGHYELGPFAMQMGLVSLHHSTPLRTAHSIVTETAAEIGHTLATAVLGSHGPTIVHLCEASYPVHVNMRAGTVMSMRYTATGHVFAAWLAPKVAQHYLDREFADSAVLRSTHLEYEEHDFQALLNDVRTQGAAQALGNPLPGIDAISVPVFDHSGNIVLALTSIGPTAVFDVSLDGPIAQAITTCAHKISSALGYSPT
ncbi:DNA-binding IclR family transcriptional regulator [Paenalcaligenes hominis]|uniref:DNA-binding IclR family transcriptional regulator n=1 Tax=Paenalcaligenes hominis TaxID=643674 RepID=A0ABX0WSI2_9BURK|nr:IclR family transcriptional regulator [Paenalcaligenes hominis]NJB65731.1 DNA-binding IclR family transcriptional regulator [Paenalcaligenes hominis]GGE63435.1 transcriptional regulator [Paenalcaligenes hominis]